MNRLLLRAALAAMAFILVSCHKSEVVIPTADGGAVRLQVISPEIVRVTQSPDGKFNDRASLAVLPQKGCTDFEVSDAMGKVHLTTGAVTVDVYKADGSIHFYDGEGNLRPFEEWRRATASIQSHFNRSWLETEYNTAILRAEQAADWKGFERDSDVALLHQREVFYFHPEDKLQFSKFDDSIIRSILPPFCHHLP